MKHVRFKYFVVILTILSFLAVACAKPREKMKLDPRGKTGSEGQKLGGGAGSENRSVVDPNNTGSQQTDAEKAAEKTLQEKLTKEQDDQVSTKTETDDAINTVLNEVLNAKKITVDELPLGSYKLAEIQNSLYVHDSKSFLGMLSIMFTDPGAIQIKSKEYAYNGNNLESLDSIFSTYLFYRNMTIAAGSNNSVKIDPVSNDLLIEGVRFNDGKKVQVSFLTDNSQAFYPLSLIRDGNLVEGKSLYSADIVTLAGGNKTKERSLTLHQLSDNQIAVRLSVDIVEDGSSTIVSNLILIYDVVRMQVDNTAATAEQGAAAGGVVAGACGDEHCPATGARDGNNTTTSTTATETAQPAVSTEKGATAAESDEQISASDVSAP